MTSHFFGFCLLYATLLPAATNKNIFSLFGLRYTKRAFSGQGGIPYRW